MSDGAGEPDIWIPEWGDMPSAARRIMPWLLFWRDGRGSCDPSQAELMRATGLAESTVREAMRWLAENGFVKRERRRRADNSLGGWRLWLNLEKLGLARSEGQNLALASAPAEGVGEPVENAGERGPDRGPENTRARKSEVVFSGPRSPENDALHVGARAGADARASSLSISLSLPDGFAIEDEVLRGQVERCLSVCGIGVDRDEADGLTDSLVQRLPGLVAQGFEFEKDIVACVAKFTSYDRARPLTSLGIVFDRELPKFRDARLKREGKIAARAKAAMAKADSASRVKGAPDRERRIEALKRNIARLERGGGVVTDLPHRERGLDGHWLDDAFARVLQAEREALAKLEAAEGRSPLGQEGVAHAGVAGGGNG